MYYAKNVWWQHNFSQNYFICRLEFLIIDIIFDDLNMHQSIASPGGGIGQGYCTFCTMLHKSYPNLLPSTNWHSSAKCKGRIRKRIFLK